MSWRCHLYAVEADQIEPIKSNAALVLGRSILAGMPSCHLENSPETLAKLLGDGRGNQNDSICLLANGGHRLGDAGEVSTDSRLLTPRDVRGFDANLQTLTDGELFRRFNGRAIIAAGVDALIHLEANWEDSGERDDSEEPWWDDWSLDQAEEFEKVAQDFEKLRTFIAELSRQGWWALVTAR